MFVKSLCVHTEQEFSSPRAYQKQTLLSMGRDFDETVPLT